AAGAATGAAPAPEGLTGSVDLAGASLSQRGWRVDHGVAPLREHLAAVLLMLGRWDVRREILLDPTCGAGTIPIEAALMGRAAPLWQEPRRPACQRLPAFHDAAGDRGPLFADARPVVIGNDQDLAALIMAKQNATAAGLSVAQGPVWRRGDFAALRSFREATNGEAVLVLPASGDPEEFKDWAAAFGEFGAKRIIITKFDATRRIGAALGAAYAAKLALAQFSQSPFISEGLLDATPEFLARRLLAGRPARLN
ncbi:MAG: hypothetical protein AAB227_12485, partial [Pseudomonadota bacterium]